MMKYVVDKARLQQAEIGRDNSIIEGTIHNLLKHTATRCIRHVSHPKYLEDRASYTINDY